jgi:hypothetical protein
VSLEQSYFSLSISSQNTVGYLIHGASSRGNLPTLDWSKWMQQQMGDDELNSKSLDALQRTGETWTKKATLFASDRDENDLFGYSLSLTENVVFLTRMRREQSKVKYWDGSTGRRVLAR